MKRFIRYLYEYEGNQKKRNVGFVKVEQDGKETTISVHGKGLCGKSNENISCYLIKLDSETGNILFVPAGEIQIGMISCGGCFCYTEELIRAGYGKTEQSVGQTCEKKDDICGLGLGDPKEAFYVALWNEEMYGDLDIARAKVFQEFDSDKTAGESKSIKSIDEKEAEVETQFGDDEETENLEEALLTIIEHAEYVLSTTPDLLPVLKEAGVVDSGGQGLVVVLRGMYDALTGKVTEFDISEPKADISEKTQAKGAAIDNVDIKFGYCTEFIIMLDKEFNEKTEQEFKAFLSSIGDSIVCVALDDIVKVHVHTNHPGQAFEKALEYGQLTKMKVDNMREEHNQKVVEQAEVQAAVASEAQKKNGKPIASNQPKKDFGFVTIAAGEGLAEIFKGLGVDSVIEGGQTMNPSTEDILNAADSVNADVVFVLPNNKNIILAAQQAASIVEGKKIVVIPTKTIPQGITAMINFEATRSAKENEDAMVESLSTVATGQLTYAVRDTSIDGKEIKNGDIMGLGDSGLLAVGKDIDSTLIEMLDEMMKENDEAELISVYYGEDVTEEDAEAVVAKIEEKYPDTDVELQPGGQPIYYYLVSVE